jgi:hypothetical protein
VAPDTSSEKSVSLPPRRSWEPLMIRFAMVVLLPR